MNPNPVNSHRISERPQVTVIVPIYNEARFIEACLASILQQDYPADLLEVLLVDGGSTDGTWEILEQQAAGHPGVRALKNPGRIQAAAFNMGVKNARGEVIVRMDAHARYAPHYVTQCVEVLRRTGAGNVGGIWKVAPGGEGLVAASIALINTMRFGTGGAKFRAGGEPGPVDTVPFGAFRRDVLERVGPMDERLVRDEDNELNSRIRAAGEAVYFDPSIQSTYYGRDTVSAFLGQMYASGLYHSLAVIINPRSCSLRHFMPCFFVVALLACAAGGFLWLPLWGLGAAVLGLYLVVDLAASIRAAVGKDLRCLLVVPWLVLATHLLYGMGTLIGFIQFGVRALAGSRKRTISGV